MTDRLLAYVNDKVSKKEQQAVREAFGKPKIRLLKATSEQILLQMPDKMIVRIHDWGLELTRIPGRRKGECKRINFDDMIVLNDALKKICPNMHELEKMKTSEAG